MTPLPAGVAGGYLVEWLPWAGGVWSSRAIPGRTSAVLEVTGLGSGETYWFRVKAYAYPHQNNDNTVVGDPSDPPIAETTTSTGSGSADGDVNHDGVVDTGDHSALMGYLFEDLFTFRPDVDCDGDADAADVAELVKQLW